MPFKFANEIAFKPNCNTQSLECIKKGKISQSKVSLSWNVLHITPKLWEKERESETCQSPICWVQAGKTCQGRCNCIYSLKWLDLTILQCFHLGFPAHVSGSLPSLLHSDLTSGNRTSSWGVTLSVLPSAYCTSRMQEDMMGKKTTFSLCQP